MLVIGFNLFFRIYNQAIVKTDKESEHFAGHYTILQRMSYKR
jgi:hypothetical protein